MNNAIVPTRQNVSISLLEMDPGQAIDKVVEVAKLLKNVIKSQGLSSVIGGREYAQVEAWQFCGTLLGIIAQDGPIHEHDDGSYEAEVHLVHSATGRIMGKGSALCGMDEKRWKTADRFARRSMAVTRAQGKAYRMNFSYIMKMAGFEGTPAEEMPDFEPKAAPIKAQTVQAPPPPPARPTKVPFDASNGNHQRALEGLLARVTPSIPSEHWPEIARRLTGKRLEDLPQVLDEWRSDNG